MLLIHSILAVALAAQIPEGAVTVVSEPEALVVWEGVQLGRTDSRGRLNISAIPLGEYDLAVSKEGFETMRRRISVPAGRRDVAFRLVAVPVEAVHAQSKPAPPANPQPSPRSVAPTPTEAKTAGILPAEPPGRAAALEVRASQVLEAKRSDLWWLWMLPLVAVLAGVLVWLARAGPGTAPTRPDPDPSEFSGLLDFAGDQGPAAPSSGVSFLDDLRRREVMAERGVDLPPEETGETAIDLDESDVRSLDGSVSEGTADWSEEGR